jgi:2-keto-4-pentenoate hydratase
VTAIDPRLAAALAIQLRQMRATLDQGAAPVGWKLGVGDRERIGDDLAVGHLTSATCLDPGAAYHGDGCLHADAEVAFELGRDVDPDNPAGAAAAIAGVGVALEIVDLARPPDDPMSVVAANVFHRAVAFAPVPASPPGRRDPGAATGQRPDAGVGASATGRRADRPRRGGRAAAGGDGRTTASG